MTLYRCAKCGCNVNVRAFILQATIRCPGCQTTEDVVFAEHLWPVASSSVPSRAAPMKGRIARDFPTAPVLTPSPAAVAAPPQAEQPAVAPVSSNPLPVGQQQCDQCQAMFTFATQERAATIDCPACQQKTSVYTILYKCESCLQPLAVPLNHCGRIVPCPRCRCESTVPWPTLHEHPASEFAHQCYWCRCPDCGAQSSALKADVGTRAVCPSCLLPMQIPPWGEQTKGEPAAAPEMPTRRCPCCQMQGPTNAQYCTLCGAMLV